eukprot:5332613-Prymnesium_polylepis.1
MQRWHAPCCTSSSTFFTQRVVTFSKLRGAGGRLRAAPRQRRLSLAAAAVGTPTWPSSKSRRAQRPFAPPSRTRRRPPPSLACVSGAHVSRSVMS